MNELQLRSPKSYKEYSDEYDELKQISKEQYIETKMKQKKSNLLLALIIVFVIYGAIIFLLLLTVKSIDERNVYYNSIISRRDIRLNSLSEEFCKLKNDTYIKTEIFNDGEAVYCSNKVYKILI